MDPFFPHKPLGPRDVYLFAYKFGCVGLMRGIQGNRIGGPDGFPAGVLRLAPAQLSEVVHPLLRKSIMTSRAPTGFKDGAVCFCSTARGP